MIEIKNDNEILISDEEGNSQLLKILFYFHNDERNADYYFIYEDETPDEVIVMKSVDGVSLEELDDEEFDEAQQVFEAYQDDPKINEIK